jgi:hypothetical protein
MNVLEAVKTIAVELLAFGFWLLAFGSGLSNQVYMQSPGWR